MGISAGYTESNAVDLYNSASGTWSTAQLSVGRWVLAATSIGNVAIFAGGAGGNFSLTLFDEGLLFGVMRVGDGVTFAWLRRADCCLLCMRCRRLPSHGVTAGGNSGSNAVDLYNSASDTNKVLTSTLATSSTFAVAAATTTASAAPSTSAAPTPSTSSSAAAITTSSAAPTTSAPSLEHPQVVLKLSVARYELAATSVGNVAFFAGGYGSNCSFCVV